MVYCITKERQYKVYTCLLDDYTYLYWVSSKDNIEIVEYLTKECNFDINFKNIDGKIPLYIETEWIIFEFVKLLTK